MSMSGTTDKATAPRQSPPLPKRNKKSTSTATTASAATASVPEQPHPHSQRRSPCTMGTDVDKATPPPSPPTARPPKRMKTNMEAAGDAAFDKSLILKLCLPFMDLDDLVLKVSEINTVFKEASLNEILRRFQQEELAMKFETKEMPWSGIRNDCSDHFVSFEMDLARTKVSEEFKQLLGQPHGSFEATAPNETIDRAIDDMCFDTNDDDISLDSTMVDSSLLHEPEEGYIRRFNYEPLYEHIETHEHLEVGNGWIILDVWFRDVVVPSDEIASTDDPFEIFNPNNGGNVFKWFQRNLESLSLEDEETDANSDDEEDYDKFADNPMYKRKRRLMELVLKRLLRKAVKREAPKIRMIRRSVACNDLSDRPCRCGEYRHNEAFRLFICAPMGEGQDDAVLELHSRFCQEDDPVFPQKVTFSF